MVIGVGIGGTFDYAAKMAKEATLRPIGEPHPEPMVADMEERLLDGRQQDRLRADGHRRRQHGAWRCTSNYAAGHGFTPVAVAFNCWINRRTRARIYNDGRVEIVE